MIGDFVRRQSTLESIGLPNYPFVTRKLKLNARQRDKVMKKDKENKKGTYTLSCEAAAAAHGL